MLGYGILFGLSMLVLNLSPLGNSFQIFWEYLNAPASGLCWLWLEKLGLPPQGEAALAMPLPAIFLQWFVIGALIALWRCRRSQRKTAETPDKKADK